IGETGGADDGDRVVADALAAIEPAAVQALLRSVQFAGQSFDAATIGRLAALPGICEDVVRDALRTVNTYPTTPRNPRGLFIATLERLLSLRPVQPHLAGPEAQQEEQAAAAVEHNADVVQLNADRSLVASLTPAEWDAHAEAAIAAEPNEAFRL